LLAITVRLLSRCTPACTIRRGGSAVAIDETSPGRIRWKKALSGLNERQVREYSTARASSPRRLIPLPAPPPSPLPHVPSLFPPPSLNMEERHLLVWLAMADCALAGALPWYVLLEESAFRLGPGPYGLPYSDDRVRRKPRLSLLFLQAPHTHTHTHTHTHAHTPSSNAHSPSAAFARKHRICAGPKERPWQATLPRMRRGQRRGHGKAPQDRRGPQHGDYMTPSTPLAMV
jgi:hypothetical protein